MKIIVLRGKSDSGKSSSLKKCFIKMLENEEFDCVWRSVGSSKDNDSVIKDIKNNWYQSNGKDARDISGVFKYKGKIIYIVTIGDSIDDIKKQLKNRNKKNGPIDLFLCSRHDNNDIKQELTNEGIKISKVVYIPKNRANDPDKRKEENEETAQELIEKIKELIK